MFPAPSGAEQRAVAWSDSISARRAGTTEPLFLLPGGEGRCGCSSSEKTQAKKILWERQLFYLLTRALMGDPVTIVVCVYSCRKYRLPLELAGQFAAIDRDGRTRDEGGLVGSDKQNRLGNLFGQTYTFKRHTRNQRDLIVLIASEPVQHPGLDGAGGNYVDPHARSRYLQRSRLGRTLDRVLARDVNRRARPTSPSKGGRHVDDAALPPRQHHAQLMLQAQQRAQHVGVKGARVALSGLLRYRTGLAFGTRSV